MNIIDKIHNGELSEEEIKKFYEKVGKSKNPKEEHKKEFDNKIKSFIHIQSIIGEPFLQTIIKNYLDDLHIIFSDDKTLIDKELIEMVIYIDEKITVKSQDMKDAAKKLDASDLPNGEYNFFYSNTKGENQD